VQLEDFQSIFDETGEVDGFDSGWKGLTHVTLLTDYVCCLHECAKGSFGSKVPWALIGRITEHEVVGVEPAAVSLGSDSSTTWVVIRWAFRS